MRSSTFGGGGSWFPRATPGPGKRSEYPERPKYRARGRLTFSISPEERGARKDQPRVLGLRPSSRILAAVTAHRDMCVLMLVERPQREGPRGGDRSIAF